MNDTEEFLQASLTKQVAILVLSQQSEREIGHQLNLRLGQVQKIKKSDEFLGALKELTEEKTSILLYRWKKRLEGAEGKAWNAFIANLEKNNMEAVKAYLTMIGFSVKPEGGDKDTVINLVMPGQAAPTKDLGTAIEVTPDDHSSGT